MPDVDASRFFTVQLIDTIRRRLSPSGYALSVVTFPLHGGSGMADLQLELQRTTDLVIGVRATPEVQTRLAESGIRHLYAFGEPPESDDSPWIRFAPKTALSLFASHCARAHVERVLQVRFEDNETLDARPALEKKGIECSWLKIPRGNDCRWPFESSARRAYETFADLEPGRLPDLLLFWNAFLAQGALTAFLARGIRLPEDVKAVALCTAGLGPVYPKSVTRLEVDPDEAGEKVTAFALAMLAKGRVPPPPVISPKYVFGSTFPF